MKTLRNLLPVIALLLCFNFSFAQDTGEMTAKKHENLNWYYITFIKFEQGKMEDAKKIIKEYFIPTDQDAGHAGPVIAFDLLFSEWDHVVAFKIEEGIQALEWEMSPRDVEWMKAFNKRAGSEAKAKEIQEEFQSYIKDYKSHLARTTGDL
ncbi:hypothetical protein [Salinimicrobium xinjiangense]|uniref:hypothetical protein n=1 Tax=Salinimicrobium xinjiangense TaxID=438596 RepID=UPI0004011DBB|nr:hypothetical protein [Salinimicrobium xinjiangense]